LPCTKISYQFQILIYSPSLRREHGRINIEVTVKRTELIERLIINREKHKNEFQEAIALWQRDFAIVIKSIDAKNLTYYPKELEELDEHCPDSYLDTYDALSTCLIWQ
jgi:hypothetical protein